jgi:hypothetical protein
MNNNKLDEPALLAGCKGVFSKTSYITFGNKDKPEEYVKKGGERSSFLGKQLGNAPPKQGKTVDVYFEKKHNWIGDGDKYVDRVRYKDTQPDKKKGFLTSDFHKTDEFSNIIRTEQFREQLRQEAKFTKKALELLGDTGQPEYVEPSNTMREETLLYDSVFAKEDPGFNGASKTHRDTKNKTMLSFDRQQGSLMTSQKLSFQPPTDFSKPEHAHKPLIQDTFFRKTNIQFPVGVCADPA